MNSNSSPRKSVAFHFPLRVGVLAVCLISASATVRADWVQATGTYDYFASANWSDGTPNGVFPSTVTLTGSQTITFGVDWTTLSSGFQFLEGGAYPLILMASGASHTITLNGDVTADLTGVSGTAVVGSATAGQNLNIDLGGVSRTFYVAGVTGSIDTLKIMNTISDGSLIKTGVGTLQLSGSNSYTGDTSAKNGALLINSSGVLSSSNIYISTTGGYTGNKGENLTTLTLDNSSTANANRIADTAKVFLNSGAFILTNPNNTSITENIGTVTLEAGANLLEVDRNGSSGTVLLNLSSLVRTNQSVLRVSGSSLGTSGYGLITLADATGVTSSMIGGGGSAGSLNISIIPWASGVAQASLYDRGATSFVTYDATYGFRLLDTANEYRQGLNTSGGNTDNVRVTASEALTANMTINSLLFDASASPAKSISGAYTLTVSSGAILARSSAASQGVNSIAVSALDFAGQEAVIGVSGTAGTASALLISGVIQNTGGNGLTKYGNGELQLSAANTYTGDTVVDEGTIRSKGNAIPDASNLRVSSLGKFVVSSGATEQVKSLAGTGTVYLDSTTARINVGTGTITGVAGKITVGIGGILSPGDASGSQKAGTLSLGIASSKATDLQLVSGAEVDIDISSTSLFDSIAVVDGSATLAGTLNLSYLNNYTPMNADAFKIITTTGGISGSFDSILLNGAAVAGYTTEVSGNDLYLIYSAVPEPSTYAMLVGGIGLLVGAQRMRRRVCNQ